MSDLAIQVENIGKLYRLGEIGTGTISHDLNRWLARVRGKEDPYAKIGETNDRTIKGESNYAWALKDVSFEVKQGEVLGIIGRNGAGKSTLLKILSKVTTPTNGQIKIKGRIASLLEVGTGFHPELTGRENVFLNGAILGMTKAEVKKKFDEIVDFSGVERYIDTPVKRYSSGMYVRLAFAVAAFLEPEILIIDEVLAVGDLDFQKKCLGRMQDINKNDGRTVLFVSHNMSAVSTLTQKCIFLSNGNIKMTGDTSSVMTAYLNEKKDDEYFAEPNPEIPNFTAIRVMTSENGMMHKHGESFEIAFEVNIPEGRENIAISFQILNQYDTPITYNWIFDDEKPICRKSGLHKFGFVFPQLKLYQGNYYIRAHLAETNNLRRKFDQVDCCQFEVAMLEMDAPEWGWQPEVCQYLESGNWYQEGKLLKVQM